MSRATTNPITALQDNILTCYRDTAAAQVIRNNGGADGKYGTATERAVRALQEHQMGFKGSEIDGVHGLKTRKAMTWHLHAQAGYPLYRCKNPNQV
ncbi:peptidoglycan-binding domain-containing protein [Prauserella cavernicola]|uniref:Peptidoglycan-binding protein n=1 Tax=Prauserella cavernicola TaxID=2800127 RepID=A0A934V6W2_9PSEU|nr:peptidoglycan-binding domain-containing protein [Prauserella cavernicola]MBK1787947.1 peptidoglycan-binding protein [Prauserella cavernicola]